MNCKNLELGQGQGQGQIITLIVHIFSGNSLEHGHPVSDTSTIPGQKMPYMENLASNTRGEVNTPALSRALAADEIPYELMSPDELERCEALAEKYFAHHYEDFQNYKKPYNFKLATGTVTE